MKLYVCAVSKKEAKELASTIGHKTKKDAEQHLKEIKAPPTDSFYGNQYKIFMIEDSQ